MMARFLYIICPLLFVLATTSVVGQEMKHQTMRVSTSSSPSTGSVERTGAERIEVKSVESSESKRVQINLPKNDGLSGNGATRVSTQKPSSKASESTATGMRQESIVLPKESVQKGVAKKIE